MAAVRRLPLSVVRAGLQAARFSSVAFTHGCDIKVHLGNGEMRSYTPARTDAAVGEMDLVAFVQGESAASRWVDALRVGHSVHFLGPGPSVPHRDMNRSCNRPGVVWLPGPASARITPNLDAAANHDARRVSPSVLAMRDVVGNHYLPIIFHEVLSFIGLGAKIPG